jgi:hypothetical protein
MSANRAHPANSRNRFSHRLQYAQLRQRAAADGAGHGGDVEPQPLLIDEPAVWAALRPASENDLATSLRRQPPRTVQAQQPVNG